MVISESQLRAENRSDRRAVARMGVTRHKVRRTAPATYPEPADPAGFDRWETDFHRARRGPYTLTRPDLFLLYRGHWTAAEAAARNDLMASLDS